MTMRCILFCVGCALLFPLAGKADGNSTAFVQGDGVAVNAQRGAFVNIDKSNRTVQIGSKEDARRIAELELQLRLGRDEIARLSRDEEGEILRRSREDLLVSLPVEIRKRYEEGDLEAVVKYLEASEASMSSKVARINLARAKTLYELALVFIGVDHVRAFEYLGRSLNAGSEFLPSMVLYVQLADRLGRVDEARRMLNSLREDGKLNSIDLKHLQDSKAGLTSFFVDAAGMYLRQGQWSEAEEIVRAGRDIAISARNRGDNSLLDLEFSLGVITKLLDFRQKRAGNIDEYSFYLKELSGVDYSFSQCKDCLVYASLAIGFNFALISYAQSVGDLDTVREVFERLDRISASPLLPAGIANEIQLQKFITAAHGAKLVGARETFHEYSEEAKGILRKNLDREINSYDRWLDLLDISLGQVDGDIDFDRKDEATRTLDRVSVEAKGIVAKTKGYELRHFDLYVRLGDQNSLLGRIVEAESFYDMANKVSSKFKEGSFAHQKSRRSYLNSTGYHWLRNGAGSKAKAASEELFRVNEIQKTMGEPVDESEWLELSARAALTDGDCKEFQNKITKALDLYTKEGVKADSEVTYISRLRRLLRLSQGCLLYGELAGERYLKLFAYSDALFSRRPWDPGLVDDVIYSLNGLSANSLFSNRPSLDLTYVEMLRNRMRVCSGYLVVEKKCKSNAAYSLVLLGMHRMPEDRLMMERALSEFRGLEKKGGLDSQSRQLYIGFLTVYAGLLNFKADKTQYVSLLKEAERLFSGLSTASKTSSMNRWHEQLQSWFASDMSREFSRRPWLYFE